MTLAPQSDDGNPQGDNGNSDDGSKGGGCGCASIIVISLALGIVIYFANFRNAEFLASDTIRSSVTVVALLMERDTGIMPLPESAIYYHDTADEREAVSQPPVKLGENDAAQLHAEAALAGCYSSHWDRWGLKPYMRFTLTGGTGANGENVGGLDYCIQPRSGYAANNSMTEEVAEAVVGWMDSPGHRRALLHPSYTTLNVGIAYDRFNTVMAQHFATDYVTFTQFPEIDQRGIFSMKGVVDHRATLDIGETSYIQVVYDPPPRSLTRGQLANTYSLCNGQRVGYIVEPLPPNRSYYTPEVRTEQAAFRCIDPYDTPPERPAPGSPDAAQQAWADAKLASATGTTKRIHIRRITAQAMTLEDGHLFDVQADLSPILRDNGPGVYTVILWGQPLEVDEPEPIAEHSIFW